MTVYFSYLFMIFLFLLGVALLFWDPFPTLASPGVGNAEKTRGGTATTAAAA